jgi:molybdopterin-guanine dinucleotide biosynthesis protein A
LAVGLAEMHDDAEAVFVTPCDVPLIRPEFIHYMFGSLGSHELAVPRVNGKWFALSSVCRPSVLPKVEQLLAQGERRVRALTKVCRTREVTAEELRICDPELQSLWNCNGPLDYQTALRHYHRE